MRGLKAFFIACIAGASLYAKSASQSAEWTTYSGGSEGRRYSPLSQINTKNAGKLAVLCTYEVDEYTAFESGLIMVDNALIGTTEFDIFSLNPATCAVNWRTHEDYPPALLPSNRGRHHHPYLFTRSCRDREGGAIGGGVITYTANGAQKIAVATGYISPAFPVEIRRAQIAILGLEGG